MDNKSIKIIQEKLAYLITMMLSENNFQVFLVDVDISLNSKNLEKPIIEEYDIFLDIEWKGNLDYYNFYDFSKSLNKMGDLIYYCVTRYTLTIDGKIINGSDTTYLDGPMIYGIDYKIDEKHRFQLSYKSMEL